MALLVLALNVASDSVVAVEHNLYKNAKVFIHDQFNFAFTLMVRRTRVLRKGGGEEKRVSATQMKVFPFICAHFRFIACDVVSERESVYKAH